MKKFILTIEQTHGIIERKAGWTAKQAINHMSDRLDCLGCDMRNVRGHVRNGEVIYIGRRPLDNIMSELVIARLRCMQG